MKCPECGSDIDDGVKNCPNCGCSIDSQIGKYTQSDYSSSKKSVPKFLIPVFIVCAVLCLIIGFTRINNDKYSFYKQHYEECVEGRDDNAGHTGMFSGTYSMIADSYQDMIDYDLKMINTFRIQAGILFVCAAGFCIAAVVVYKKGKK